MTSQQGQAEFDPLPISCPARSVTCSGWGTGEATRRRCARCFRIHTCPCARFGEADQGPSVRHSGMSLLRPSRLFPLYFGGGGGARSGHWGVLESTMKLHPCLAEPILALHPHELTPPLSPDPVFSCFISAPSPERGGGAPGSAPGPDAADNPQAMRPRDRAGALCCFPPGRGHCRSCDI